VRLSHHNPTILPSIPGPSDDYPNKGILKTTINIGIGHFDWLEAMNRSGPNVALSFLGVGQINKISAGPFLECDLKYIVISSSFAIPPHSLNSSSPVFP
jgi:hypothetical protein